jgi:hypothetical protein
MIGTLILIIIVVTSGVLGEKRSITLVARDDGGRNVTLQPRYVEVRGDGVVLHPTMEFVPAFAVGDANTPLRRLLSRVEARKDAEYVIVAVRPDGFTLFDQVRDQVEGRGIQIGYEPLDADWKLRIRTPQPHYAEIRNDGVAPRPGTELVPAFAAAAADRKPRIRS